MIRKEETQLLLSMGDVIVYTVDKHSMVELLELMHEFI